MPIYEYKCFEHGVFEAFLRTIPDEVPRWAECPYGLGGEDRCAEWAKLVPSLVVCGDAQIRTELRLTREQRRYHGRAPEREKALHDRKASRKKSPITSAEVRDRMERQERGAR